MPLVLHPCSLRRRWAAALLSVVSVLALPWPAAAEEWPLASPNGRVRITVRLGEPGAPYPAGRRLYYRVDLLSPARAVIAESPLGIVRDDRAFVEGLVAVAQTEPVTIDEPYALLVGRRRSLRNHARERTLTFADASGARLEVVVRAYDTGAAFRYRFAEESKQPRTILEEATGFRLPEGSVGWMQPYDDPTQYTPAYEAYYENAVPAGTASPKAGGWGFPVLFRTGDGAWALVTEAGLEATYAGTRLAQASPDRIYRIRFPDPGEGHRHGDVSPRSTLPWATPWRVIAASETLAGIVESTLVTDVSPASRIADTSWIKPGRAAWDWWSGPHAGAVNDVRKRFVDLAAAMGWEYYLIDANWTDDDLSLIREIVEYARGRNVGILLWYNSGGAHNIVTERPRDRLYEREQRRREFQWLEELGIKGVKVDFFQSDKQASIALHLDILKDAADFHLMVNFHGTTLPRGWERTYPNLITMEAVRGAESYKFDKTFPDRAPELETILPFTRNVAGPMDYTPVALTPNTYPRKTTDAHELALPIVFESGWVHFADTPQAYLALPETPRRLLREIPAAWDDVRLVAGEPGRFVVIARRSGGRWFIGGISAEPAPRTVDLRLPFLEPGAHTVDILEDGQHPGFLVTRRSIDAAATITVTMQPRGGFVAEVSKSPTPAATAAARRARPAHRPPADPRPRMEMTAQQDHRRTLGLLGIGQLRPGPSGNPSAPNAANSDESKANPYPTLPALLTFANGRPVTSARAWRERRREILELFDREVYGRMPAVTPPVRWEETGSSRETVGGVPVIVKKLSGRADNSAHPTIAVNIELTLTTPAEAKGPVPVMLHFGFRWPPGFRMPPQPGPSWQQLVLAKGWGYAELIPTSVQPDNGAGLTVGIIGLVNEGQPREVDDWGALRAWAWGASRALDYFEIDPAVDATRVGIEGLSRYGKAAIVTMAYDERFAVGFIGSSGAGGAKLHRRHFGEQVENVASAAEYHWMAGNYLKYAGPLTPDDLPVDAHQLVAACAPRPVFISAGSLAVEGTWIDPKGMFLAGVAAGPAYELLGRKGLGASEFPPEETALVDGEIAWRQHSGGHTTGPNWPAFLAWADRYMSRSSSATR